MGRVGWAGLGSTQGLGWVGLDRGFMRSWVALGFVWGSLNCLSAVLAIVNVQAPEGLVPGALQESRVAALTASLAKLKACRTVTR